MSKERQETIEDIINEKRTTAREIRSTTPNQYGLELAVMLEVEADRIEAAWKREREAGAEAAQICGEIGEMIGREAACKQSVTDCNRLGDAAKMREACDNIVEYAKSAACHTEDEHLLGYLNQIEKWAEAALATPTRNCDRFINAKDALKAFERETGESMAIEFIKWLFAEAKGATNESK